MTLESKQYAWKSPSTYAFNDSVTQYGYTVIIIYSISDQWWCDVFFIDNVTSVSVNELTFTIPTDYYMEFSVSAGPLNVFI